MQISVSITDNLTPELQRMARGLKNKRPLMYAAGKAAERAIKEYYLGLPANRYGFPSRGFWRAQGADKTRLASFDEGQATVVVDSVEMGHKYFGGPVEPKRATYLTIPLNAAAYAIGSPQKLMTGAQVKAAMKRKASRRAPERFPKTFPNGATWLFTRLPVMHKPDPRAFPPKEKIEPEVLAEIERRMALIMRVS